ncbi:helix-turn-helix domain-containing protein [Kitasatospora sp. NPDC001574]
MNDTTAELVALAAERECHRRAERETLARMRAAVLVAFSEGMTPRQVAALTGLTTDTVRRWRDARRTPAQRGAPGAGLVRPWVAPGG